MGSLRRAAALAITLTVAGISTASADEVFATNGVAINGYDPVAYFTDHKPVKGSQKYTAAYEGATFYFASADHRDMFASDPMHYAPQFGGYCAFGTAEGHKAPTQPQAFTVIDGKLYLNYNDEILNSWRKDIPGYIAKANANWGTVKTQPAP